MLGITPLNKAMPQTSKNITLVRMAVAKSESISFTPTFAKMAVSDAKNADKRAYIHHIKIIFVKV